LSKISIKSIAKKAGVSISTVSHALNETRYVKKETKEKIRELAEKYNYIPNRIARSLRTDKTNYIGFFVPNLSYFFYELILGANSFLNKRDNYLVLFNSENSYEMEKYFLDSIFSRKIDGVMISGIAGGEKDREVVESLLSNHIPCVFIDRFIKDINIPKIITDNYKGGKLAADYLVKTGHRKIGVLTYKLKIKIFDDRYRGFKNELKKNNLKELFCLELESENLKVESELDAIKKDIINRRCSAIFCESDLIAVYLINYLRKENIRVPEDISIIGFDNIIFSSIVYPKITTIAQDIPKMGELGAEVLINLIKGKKCKDKYLLEPKIIVRDSVRKM